MIDNRKQIQYMSTGPRQKLCAVCGKDWKTMYRIKYKEGAEQQVWGEQINIFIILSKK